MNGAIKLPFIVLDEVPNGIEVIQKGWSVYWAIGFTENMELRCVWKENKLSRRRGGTAEVYMWEAEGVFYASLKTFFRSMIDNNIHSFSNFLEEIAYPSDSYLKNKKIVFVKTIPGED